MARIDIKSNGTGGGGGGGNLQLAGGASMDATLRAVTDTSNTASPLKLSTASVQVNSPLRITTSDASGFYLDAEDSATNNRFSIKRDPSSQEVTLDFASNPAGSTTLVGAIRTYQDGVNLSNAMSFIEDGSVGIGTNTPIGILHLKRTAATTRMVMDGDAGQSKIITYRTAGLQRFGLYVNNTAESGSNAGSDFAVRAYNDAGTLITTALFIKRSTGFLGVGNVTAPTQQLHVNGSLRIETGGIYDGTNSIGTSGQVLSSTGTSTAWITPSSGGTPAGSTGAIQFNNAGAFGADSTNFFWDDTNDRLGINTNAPTTALQVNYSSASLDGILVNQTGGSGNFSSIGFSNGGSLRATLGMNLNTGEFRMSGLSGGYFPTFYANGVEAMRIDTSRNVGIGINAPTARLQVKGSGATSSTTSLLVQNSAGTQLLKVTDDGATTANILSTTGATSINNGSLYVGSNFVTSYGQSIGFFGATVASAIVEIQSTTKGFLPPRMTNAQRAAIGTPAIGLMVYCTDAVEGLYVYKSTGWTFVI
jgi:hypothetical protein